MAIIRWDPWAELSAWERQLGSLFGRPEGRGQVAAGAGWAPPLDVHQEGDTMIICAEVPGMEPSDLDISVEDDVLTLSGERDDHSEVQEGDWIRRERHTGRFQRSVRLPPGVDPSQIQATANHGMIEIRVPRPSVASGRHKVELKGGTAANGGSGSGASQVEVETTGGSESSDPTSPSGSTGTSGGSSTGSSSARATGSGSGGAGPSSSKGSTGSKSRSGSGS